LDLLFLTEFGSGKQFNIY